MDGSIETPGDGDVVLGPVRVPAPRGVSPQARDYLATPFWAGGQEHPHPNDIPAWQAMIAQVDEMYAPLVEAMHAQSDAAVEKLTIGGVTVYAATPRNLPPGRADKAHLHIHGGGWAFMGGAACGGHAAMQATRFGVKTWSVDYRAPPAHRFPAALDDCLAVYAELIKSVAPGNVVISGSSAGGNLSAAVGLRIRDAGLAMPAAIALLTPCADGLLISDAIAINDQLDTVLKAKAMASFWAVYAGGHDRADPYLSPVYADYAQGFAPTLLQTGTRDLLLSDTVRLHRAMRRGGVEAQLHVWEAMPHGGFGGAAPEDAEVNDEIMAFFEAHWGR